MEGAAYMVQAEGVTCKKTLDSLGEAAISPLPHFKNST